MSAIVPYSKPSLQVHKTRYRVGNTPHTKRASEILQLMTGLDLSNGHLTVEHAQRATAAADYYSLQVKLMRHINKKYGAVLKSITTIEDLRLQLQTLALDKDKEVAGMVAELTKLSQKHGLELEALKSQTEKDVKLMHAQHQSDQNVQAADFRTRLQMIARGERDQVRHIQRTSAQQYKDQLARQKVALQARLTEQKRQQILTDAMDNKISAGAARGFFQRLGSALLA